MTSVRFALPLLILATGLGGTASARQDPVLPLAPKELRNRPTNIVLRLSENGTPAINHQTVEWSRLGVELQAIYGRRPEKLLFMVTSPRDKVTDIRRVVAIARRHGVQVFALPSSTSPA
jgi:biopolymer transport protein ExbD